MNIGINKFTEHEAVEHEFLVEHWHEVESVLWNTRLQLKDGDDVERVARATANSAVEHGMLHHTLVEHAVLWTLKELS
ncbi:hypothetical protein FPL11_01895 [Spiribacter aquaticus]|uniref:Uncharacterized protein n=1 Tax=Spiribacter aquaticus TaxID=1935996 RepID=A0A557RMP9_9GAMM|nr:MULTISPECIES: hypothetical protein [Spiribacter]TVO66459.1 hypothetical protein FPL11_01895 [Spiribacter aquaticus]